MFESRSSDALLDDVGVPIGEWDKKVVPGSACREARLDRAMLHNRNKN